MSTRTVDQERVADLLRTARSALGLSMAFLSRLDGTTQHLEVVESKIPLVMKDGTTTRQSTSFCQAILDGRLPAVIGDVSQYPEAKALPAAKFPRIRSYVSVPVQLSDGSLYGTFCVAGLRADRELQERDRALMEVLARAAALIVEPGIVEERRRDEVEARLLPLMDAGGPTIVVQPIVSLETGAQVGVEALSRFPAQWGRPPDVCYAEAHSVGRGTALELLAIRQALGAIGTSPGYVAVNASAATIADPAFATLVREHDMSRIVLELSEHDPVDDYLALMSTFAPLREEGMRLAIDDVGSGFSSLRHIVETRPDVIKLDRSLVAGVAQDEVLSTLCGSLARFAEGLGARTVAEGIETSEDADVLAGLGIDYGQGWLFGRPAPVSEPSGPAPSSDEIPPTL